jgi:hypothetical protein
MAHSRIYAYSFIHRISLLRTYPQKEEYLRAQIDATLQQPVGCLTGIEKF